MQKQNVYTRKNVKHATKKWRPLGDRVQQKDSSVVTEEMEEEKAGGPHGQGSLWLRLFCNSEEERRFE